jgi:hypothetical protein
MKLKTRGAPDFGGRVVDIFPAEGSVNLILFTAGPDTDRDALSARAVALLRELAASGKPVLSDRDFPVWFVQVAERAEIPALTGLAVPARMSSKVFPRLRDPLAQMDEFRLSEHGDLENLDAEPLLRYSHGSVIAYVDPLEAASDSLPDGVDELRSAEVPAHVTPRSSGSGAEPLTAQGPREHSLESWARVSSQMEEWIDELWEPVSYAALRRMATEQLGIAVHDEPDAASVGKYGCIRTGWRFAGETCSVRILLAPHHHDDLKYAILAHELGHYCHHFPLLHHAQLVEELSWGVPEVRLLYDMLVDWKITYAGVNLLEDDADVFASTLLVPPRYLPAADWASGVFSRDRPLRAEEVIFNAMQRLFPGRRERFTAMSLDELRAAAQEETTRRDLASADDDSIYSSMLRACLAREDGVAPGLEAGVADGIADVVQIHNRHIEQWFAESAGEDPEDRRVWWQRVLLELDVDQVALPPGDTDAEIESGARKVVLPPLGWDGISLYPSLPLHPESYNLEGAPDNDWRCLIDERQPPGTVDEWRAAWPEHGMVLYRFETWQRDRLARV